MHILSQMWNCIQQTLFPFLAEALGPLTEKQQQLAAILELVRIEDFARTPDAGTGRKAHSRGPLARAFTAKTVLNLPTTRALIEQLASSTSLRRLCGWENRRQIPDESTFSRVFAEFALGELPHRVHAALIEKYESTRIIGHISRDSTAIEAREKAVYRPKVEEEPEAAAPAKRGRRKKGEERPAPEPTRLERQASGKMKLTEMIDELPTVCDFGCKKNSQGKVEKWKGYKGHIDWADGMIPISMVLTSASVHDSQVAIPLAETTAGRVTNLYDLMDSAYDAAPIHAHSAALGHVPIIDRNFRKDAAARDEDAAERAGLARLGHALPEHVRYNERTNAERGNARLKDEFGGRTLRVRGAAKVMAHLMFGILALAADQLLRLAQ